MTDLFLEGILKLLQPAGDSEDVFVPNSFKEYIGQENVKKLLQIAIEAAQKENRPLPNMMISGAFGLGKSVLADIVYKEYGKTPTVMDGASISLKNLPKGMVIIDEIHNIPPEICDTLSLELDKGNLHILGCTTSPGTLPAAFRSRFRTYQLEKYTVEELSIIAGNICKKKGVTAKKLALDSIAFRSRFNARQLTLLLSNIFDSMTIKGTLILSDAICLETFNLLGVDQIGLLERDRQYVRSLPNRPVGINSLSAMLGIDSVTIQEEIEPYLLQLGIIDRTPQGRVKIREI